MALSLKLVVISVIQILSIFQVSSEKSLRTISLDEYNNLAASTTGSFVVVYYDNKVARKNFPQFLKEYRKAVDELDTYGIELLRIDCKGLSLPECSETDIQTFRNGIAEDNFGLEVVFNKDAIVSNLLMLLIKDDITYISIENNELAELKNKAKASNKNIVFCYVQGFGNSEHAVITKVAYVFGDKYKFGLTTDKKVAEQIKGLPTTSGGSIAVHYCQDLPADSDDDCKVFTPSPLNVVNVAQLLQLLQYPKYVHMADNGTTIYDSLPLSVHKAYIFTKDVNNIDQDGLQSIVADYFGSVAIIIVDVNKHKDKLSSFGLCEKDTFPTGAFLPAAADKSEPIVELFPNQVILFGMENFKHIISQHLRIPKKQARLDALSSSLRSITFEEFAKISSTTISSLFSKPHLLVAFCEDGSTRSECRDFSKDLRRVVRTFDRIEDSEVDFVHVTLSNGGDNEIGTPKRPHVRLYSQKGGDQNFILFHGKPNYQGLMDFLAEETRASLTRLMPSNSDSVPINPGGVVIDGEEEQAKAEEDSELGESTIESAVTPPEETEDDEVAGSVWYTELPKVPEDKVPSLTDKTFQPTRDQNDLLVVNFFQPWDPRSRAVVRPYIEAAYGLDKIDVGNFNIRLARVNCFDWTDVCQHNNISTYPTIKLYRKGSDEFVYKGPLDADHLIKTVLMLHTESPLKLDTPDQVQSFLTGKLPLNADKASHMAVLGMFASVDSKELKAFTEAAKDLHGAFIFGFMTGKAAEKISTSYGIKTPGIKLMKRNDAIQTSVVFDREFAPSNIVDFVQVNSLPIFGELTPLDLPRYYKHGRPLLIVFRGTAIEDTTYSPIIENLAEDSTLRNSIFLTWISLTSNDVNEVILQTYTGKKDTPALIIVNHKQGVVYQFKNEVSSQEVSDWIERCLSGEENPSSKLLDGKWEPLLEGYDYLAMMDKEEEEAKKKEEREEGEENSEEEESGQEMSSEKTGPPMQKVERLRQRKPEDFRDEDERKEHDEL